MTVIADVVKVTGGGTPRKSVASYYGGGIPWVTPKDMKRPVIGESEITLTEEGVRNSPAKLVPAGSVLVVVRSGVLKHTLPVALTNTPVTLNQDMKALVPTDAVDGSYLARAIKARSGEVLGWVRATTADNFPVDKLLELDLPLPPLAEQRRIAAILDAADAIRAKRRQTLTHLDTLTHALFDQMFVGPDVATVPFGDLVDEFRYGTSNKSGDGGFPALRIPNVIGGAIDTAEIKTVEVTAAERQRLALRDGDLLFVRTNGNPDNVGRAAVFSSSSVDSAGYGDIDWIYASYLIRARLKCEAQPDFVAGYLASAAGRKNLRGRAKTSAGQFNINIEALASIPIPKASLADQQTFAARTARIAAERARVQAALTEDDALFASLQSCAFVRGS